MENENPNAFKLWINEALIDKIAKEISRHTVKFDCKKFVLIKKQLAALELKPRVILVADQIYHCLPVSYPEAIEILVKASRGDLSGFSLWPFTYYVEKYGTDHFEESMNALYILTQKFTSEFAVRPFIDRYPERTLKLLKKWAGDSNVHVRRWASEGSRPRLPWGMKLAAIDKNPLLTLPILECLKYDEELYVRKSVANHLNDFSKNHADAVVKTLTRWKKDSPPEHLDKILWIVKHSSRTLIKNGHVGALKLMGVKEKINIQLKKFVLDKTKVKMNQKVNMQLCLASKDKKPQKIIVDYVIHYIKANGKSSKKVFKWKACQLDPAQTLVLKKNHHFKQVTTRKHYPGLHKIEVQVNGNIVKSAQVELL